MRDQIAIILTATIFGLTYGLSAPLIALQLDAAGWGELAIGLNAAMHAVGVLLIAPYLPSITARFGIGRTALAALQCAAALLLLFPIAPALWLWFPLRMALGAVSETLFVVSETWLNQITKEVSRARSMAAYTASLSLGFALGPVVINLVGGSGSLPFWAGAGIALFAAVPLTVLHPEPHSIEEHPPMSVRRAFSIAPIAICAGALNAALETAGLTLLPLYAIDLGWSKEHATLLITILMVGAIVLQAPIGWLADHVDRRRLALTLTVVSTVGAAVWPWALAEPWLAFPLLFVWGGAFVGIYTLMMTLLGSQFRDGELIGLYANLSVAWGIGALLGPSLGGAAMQVTMHGLPIFAAAGCAALAILLLRSRSTV